MMFWQLRLGSNDILGCRAAHKRGNTSTAFRGPATGVGHGRGGVMIVYILIWKTVFYFDPEYYLI